MKLVFLAVCFSAFSLAASAQPYNTISGTVWRETATADGIRTSGEPVIDGVLASLIDQSTGLVVASAISNTSGVFTLNNYTGTGTFKIDYSYPGEGFTITSLRTGGNDALNNAADPLTAFNSVVSTPDFTISSSTNLNTYGLGLVRVANTLTYYVSKPSTATDWSQTFVLPKSDNSIYGLTNRAVIFATNASYYPILGIENTSTSAGSPTAKIASNGSLELTLPTVPTLLIDASSATKNANLSIYDGVTDYGGTSGKSFLNEAGSGINSRAYTSVSDLNNYFRSTGPATFNIPAAVTRASTFSGGGNLQAVSSANSAAGIFVTYRYPTAIVLPISLVSFTAKKNGETALVQWKVATELSKNNYIIERSNDGRLFTEIGSVAVNNATGVDQSYQFLDMKPLSGKNIYRLRQVENTGKTNYSVSAIVIFGNSTAFTAAYPNPANSSLFVETAVDSKISLFNTLGQAVKVEVKYNGNQAVLNTINLVPGNYILKVTADGVSNTQQILIQH